MTISLSSHSGGAIGQNTIMLLLVSLLSIVFSYATSISDHGGEYAVKSDDWLRKEGMEGFDIGLDHQYHIKHTLKSKEERIAYIKTLMAAKAEKQRKIAMESGKVLEEVRGENMTSSPFDEDGADDKLKNQKKYKISMSAVTIKVGEFKNITLHGVAWVPKPHSENPNEKFPVVIFPNSWVCPDFEYILPTAELAQKGYVAIGYETRGWYLSGGEINVAGDKDRADASEVIDFLLSDERAKEWNINTSAVAFAGISYGAGISQMMAGYDRRVKTVVSMSGWGDILKALYGYESVNIGAIEFLITSAKLVGRVPKYLIDVKDYLKNNTHMDFVEAFAKERSPSSFINAINARNRNGDRVSVFMSANMGDDFFAPQHSIGFWQQLEVPKMLLVNQGDHAEEEMFGLVGIPNNHIWGKVGKWLDHELKGIDNGILTDPVKEPQVAVQAGDSVFSSDYIPFPKGWPRSTNSASTARKPKSLDVNAAGGPVGSFIVEYELSARGGASGTQYGGLNLMSNPRNRNPFTSLRSHKQYNADPSLNTISYATKPAIGGGMYLISGFVSGLGLPVTAALNRAPTATAILYSTPPMKKEINSPMGSFKSLLDAVKRDFFDQPRPRNKKNSMSSGDGPISSAAADTMITICGSPEIKNFTFTPSAVWPEDKKRSFSDRWQLYAFLYDQKPTNHINGWGVGSMISDGAFTHNTGNNNHDGTDNVHIWQREDGTTAVTIKSFVMRTVCRRIPEGNRLVLGFTLAYPGYFLPAFPSSEESKKSLDSTQPLRSSGPSLYNSPPLLPTSHLEVEVQYDAGSVLRVPLV